MLTFENIKQCGVGEEQHTCKNNLRTLPPNTMTD
jgi:hypothetical protein